MESQEIILARAAYSRYGAVTDYKNFLGQPMPTWDELPAKIKDAWLAAANPPQPTENLTFSQALDALKKGFHVTRAIWSGHWIFSAAKALPTDYQLRGKTLSLGNLIIACLKDGGHAPAQPYQADLLASDWKIISAPL